MSGDGRPWRPSWAQVRAFVQADDALPFTLGDDDVRVERGEWVYYVRAVHRGQWLRQDFAPMDLISFALFLVFSGFVDAWRRGRPWKVGVLRQRKRGWRRIQLLHKEVLADGATPQARVEELVRDVGRGVFDPAVRPQS